MSARHERNEAQRLRWAHDQEERERYCREHPVLSGAVPYVDYVEPQWRYVRPQPIKNGLDMPI